jgi:hypothetical protein
MSEVKESNKAAVRPRLTLDWWAVLLSLAAAALVRFDLIRSVKW